MMRISYLILILFSLELKPLYATWQRPVTNYTRYDYEAGTQNWMLEQLDNGWIYVANNKGLLEFDGVNWNLYPIQGAKMKAVKKGSNGVVYVGGITQFGYFVPDKLGGLRYTSLVGKLPSHLNPGVIRNIWIGKEQVYFQSDRYIFCLNGEELAVIDGKGEITSSGIVNQMFYVTSGEGLSVLRDGKLQPVSGTGELAGLKVVCILPYRDKMLLVTRNHGIYLYDHQGVRKKATSADAFISKSGAFCAKIHGTRLAIGTVQGGVCLLDMETDEMEVISIEGGLQNKTVLGAMFDVDGNLWLGLDNGVDYVQLNSPLFSLYGNRALIGSGYASCVYRGMMYLGTNQGVYRTSVPNGGHNNAPVDFVQGTGGQVWDFLLHDGKLFGALDNGVFFVDGNRVERLPGLRGVRRIISLPHHPDVLVAGTYGVNRGLHLLRKKQGHWAVEGKIDGCDVSCKNLLADPSDRTVWVANKGDGIYRLRLSDDLRKVERNKLYSPEKLPYYHDVCLARIDGSMVVASRYGLWRYDETKDALVEFPELETRLDGAGSYTYVAADSLHNIWYSDGNAMKVARYDASRNVWYKNRDEVFLDGLMIECFESVSTYNGSAVIGSEWGFSLLDMQDKVSADRLPAALHIRKVYLTGQGDSLIYGRSYLPDSTAIAIPYRYNSLRIEYCTNDYRHAHSATYAYQLVRGGKEGAWSEYSRNNTKEFTGLREGKYLFNVRLHTEAGELPAITSFAFEVLPPWYRTWWSYLAYVAVFCLFVYYICYRIADSRKRLIMEKELEIYHQQQAFKKESSQKDRKIASLQEENLQAELRHKSEELIRTTLNIVRKNEMLQEIKKEVLGISHSINEENLISLRRKTLRLLGQIDTNIEHDDDLQAFQSTFDSVHHYFFRNLEEAYPELTHKEKLLCAYIKMSLLSKEIAPLMNVSLRGVEISRYRLRRKLGLEEGENLSEFLQKFSTNRSE